MHHDASLQLGTGTTSYATKPVKVVGLEDTPIADISAGGWHSLALTTSGGAHCRLRPHKLEETISCYPGQETVMLN